MSQLPAHPPDWIDMAPLRNVGERRIAGSRDAVWARIADHATWPAWFTALKTVRVTGAAAGVDGRREVSMPGGKVGEVFTVWEPGEQFAFAVERANRTLAGMAESVELRDDGDGCVVTYRQGIEPARGFGWLWKLILPRMRRELTKALDQLAALVEAT
jgi:uncharacterized protein YndB with AHSA1/START domain